MKKMKELLDRCAKGTVPITATVQEACDDLDYYECTKVDCFRSVIKYSGAFFAEENQDVPFIKTMRQKLKIEDGPLDEHGFAKIIYEVSSRTYGKLLREKKPPVKQAPDGFIPSGYFKLYFDGGITIKQTVTATASVIPNRTDFHSGKDIEIDAGFATCGCHVRYQNIESEERAEIIDTSRLIVYGYNYYSYETKRSVTTARNMNCSFSDFKENNLDYAYNSEIEAGMTPKVVKTVEQEEVIETSDADKLFDFLT